MVHQNSKISYEETKAEGKLTKRQALILQWLLANPGSHTDREIAQGLRFTDMNAVRPRITELVDQRLLEEVSTIKCDITGRPVRKVAPVFRQAELPLL